VDAKQMENANELKRWILECPVCRGEGGWSTPAVYDRCWACHAARVQLQVNYGIEAGKKVGQ
jgi:hypothetical protein